MTFKDEGLNVKGLMAVINDSPDDMCGADNSRTVKGSNLNLGQTGYLDGGISIHMIRFKSLLMDF